MATSAVSKFKKTVSASLSKKIWSERERWVSQGVYHYGGVAAVKGKGALVWDADGKRYIDFGGGIGTLNVGHCHPLVVQAVREQASKLIHTCYSVSIYDTYAKVCEKLIRAMPGNFAKKAVLFNSGAEAVENAVKLAKLYTKRPAVIAFENSFHGRTYMAMTLTGKERPYKTGLAPFMPEVYHAPFPYSYRPPKGVSPDNVGAYALECVEKMLDTRVAPERVAAIIVEPVQGEGGFVAAPQNFMAGLRKLCDKYGIVLIIDEVQTGFGRTGKMFACEHYGVAPDLMTAAKSIAGGMPLSGVVGRADIVDSPEAGGIGGTYAGNPLSCAAALAVFEIFAKEKLVARSQKIGNMIRRRFESFKKNYPFVGEVRGLGAMMAMEMVEDTGTKKPLSAEKMHAIIRDCEENGLILLKSGLYGNVIRSLVPLVATDEEINKGLDILDAALKKIN